MNSTKLVFKNWFHFNFLLLLLFAFGHFFCSQEDCVLFKMPGTLWEGRFLPSSLHFSIKRSPQLTVSLWSHRSVVVLFPERTVPRKDRHHKDTVQVSWGYSWCSACIPRWSNPVAVGCAVTPISGKGGKAGSVSVQLPRWGCAEDLLLQQVLTHRMFCDKALVGVTPTLHKVSALGTKSCADLQSFESAKFSPKM